MKNIQRADFLFKILAVLFCICLTACGRHDYSPAVHGGLKTSSKQEIKGKTSAFISIRRGDTLYGIAKRYGIPIRKLIEVNRLRPPYMIYPGSKLKRPKIKFHISRAGETAYGIARRYKINMGTLVRINRIRPPYRLRQGQRLRLPDPLLKTSQTRGAWREKTAFSNRRKIGILNSPSKVKLHRPKNYQKWRGTAPRSSTNATQSGRKNFLWPVKGRVIVGFGPRKGGFHNDGINILARAGTPVRSAEKGKVIYVGNQLQGFGNLVLIKHSDGWISAYAHGSSVLVKRGSLVRRGQVIAKVGRTGNVDRPQLHFELRRGDEAVDPRNYLVRFALGTGFRRFAFLDGRQDFE